MVHAPSTPSTMGMTHGTPSSVPRFARLMLQMATTTRAATAIKPTLINVRLGGGATSPLRRRRESLSQIQAPNAATRTPAPIHDRVGSIAAHIRLYRTCWFSSMPEMLGNPENG